MRIYFDYYGDFSKYTPDDIALGAIEFDYKGKHYIVDVVGYAEYDCEKDYIGGRIKGDYELLFPDENIPNEELEKIILEMDTSTFRYNIMEDGIEPKFNKRKIEIWIGDKHIEFTTENKE